MFRPSSSALAPIREIIIKPSQSKIQLPKRSRTFFSPSFSRQSPFPRSTAPVPSSANQQSKSLRNPLSTKKRGYWTFPSPSFQDRHPVISIITRLGISTVIGLGLVVGVILIHDTFTYSERHVERVPTNPLSLNPRRGGKKNLPILEVNLDEEEDEIKKRMSTKPRLVIVGGGWGVSHFPYTIAFEEMEKPGEREDIRQRETAILRYLSLSFDRLSLYYNHYLQHHTM